MIIERAREFLAVLQKPVLKQEDCVQAANQFMEAVQRDNDPEAVAEASRLLGETLDWDNLDTARFAVMVAGGLIEYGYSAEPLAEAFVKRAPAWLAAARQYNPSGSGWWKNLKMGRRTPEQEMPPQMGWQRLEKFYFPFMAALGASVQARTQLSPLREVAEALSDQNNGAHFLGLMLSVLDKEPLLVIEPSSLHGFVGTMSGIVDNAQLQTLLMDSWSSVAGEPVISREIVETMRGQGPQSLDTHVTGKWNLYNWAAIDAQKELSTSFEDTTHWIWFEGKPEDIETFGGYRVVLLGPPSYERNWQAQRMFATLKAEIEVQTWLTPEESQEWLSKMIQNKA